MFTDMVASTATAATMHDDRWRVHLDTHDAVIRETITRFERSVISHTGDGFCATFSLPSQALACATTLMHTGFPRRVGVHAGECERRQQDIAGVTVHIAARVASAADAGEILVSNTIRELVLGSSFRFRDRGTSDLKGVPDPLRLFVLVPEDDS